MAITRMEAVKTMHNKIYKFGLLFSVIAFSFFSFSSVILAYNYGEGNYGPGPYSEDYQGKSYSVSSSTGALNVAVTSTPTSSTTPASNVSISRTLKVTMTGNDVKTLQNYLNTNGYNSGTADGYFGLKTKAGVILFQKAKGLVHDGIVGPKTREIINKSPTPAVTPSSAIITRTLKITMTGEDVKALQNYLNTNGYNIGIADGDFGLKTKAGVILFQKAKGLVHDGIVGPKTINLMK